MKIKVLFKRLDKHSGEIKSFEYKSFDMYDYPGRERVLRSIDDVLMKWIGTESIFQIETFLEHEVTELDLF